MSSHAASTSDSTSTTSCCPPLVDYAAKNIGRTRDDSVLVTPQFVFVKNNNAIHIFRTEDGGSKTLNPDPTTEFNDDVTSIP